MNNRVLTSQDKKVNQEVKCPLGHEPSVKPLGDILKTPKRAETEKRPVANSGVRKSPDAIAAEFAAILAKQEAKPAQVLDGKSATPGALSTDNEVNQFRRFWNLGYRRLIPIAQPGVEVSETSKLYKKRDDLGKIPGRRHDDGLWRSFDWLRHETSTADLDAWHQMAAGVGIRCGDGLVAVDVDTLSPAWAEKIEAIAKETLGLAARRVGRAPKALRIYRVSEAVPYSRVLFDDGLEHAPNKEPRVELLSDGKQFVAYGLHPQTGKQYDWPNDVARYEDLKVITPAQVSTFFDRLKAELPKARPYVETLTAERQVVDQTQLIGKLDDVARAVAALPNTSSLFPDHDAWVAVGYKIKGALQNDPEQGLELFQEWSSRWTDGTNDSDYVADEWARMKPPFRVGARDLYALAERHSKGAFSVADVWFKAGPAAIDTPAANSFDEQARTDAAAAAQSRLDALHAALRPMATYDWRSARATRSSIVDNWFYEDIGHIAAPGGVGKTTLLLWQAVHIILGRDLFGHQIKRPGAVVYATKEDDGETLVARARRMCEGLKLPPEEFEAVLRGLVVLDVAECAAMRGFRLTRISGEVVTPSDDAVNLAKALKGLRPSMTFLDPAVSFGVGESRVNDSEQALIEAARLIQREVGGGVQYVHHTGKANAREKHTDQYTGRGGSAFADGSRAIHIMQALAPEEWVKATGDTLQEGESGVVYARPKLTWSSPQPSIYIKRRGYIFERVESISSTKGDQMQRDRDDAALLEFLRTEGAAGRRYSARLLDDSEGLLKSRGARRGARTRLLASGRLVEETVPTGGRGKPPLLLKPVVETVG